MGLRVKLKNIMALAKDWVRDVLLGERGEEIVYNELRKDSYTIEKRPYIEEGVGISLERKIEKAREEKFKPDAIMRKGKESWFIDVKTKTKEAYLGWVNERDYKKYWSGIKELSAQMKIFFLIKSTGEIWVHDLRDPERPPKFPTEYQWDALVYAIPCKELKLYKRLEA